MNLFRFECRKIFRQKGFAALVLLCGFLNLFLLNHSVNDGRLSYRPQEYRSMMEELRSFSPEEAYGIAWERREELQQADVYLLTEQEIQKLCPYTGNLWDEKDLLQVGMEELEHVMGYDAYLKGIQDDARNMREVSIFQKSSGYSVRNLEKTANDFRNLEGLLLCFDISQGITWATEYPATDLLGALLLFASCVFLILNEKQNRQLALIVCTARGRLETGITKIGVLFLSSALITGILYAENFIYTGIVYGFGDLNRPVQSVPAFHSCILKITVFEYFLLFLAVKILVYFVSGLLWFWFCLRFQQILQIFVSFLGVIGLEFILWKLIPGNSAGSSLKYLNLFNFLQTGHLLTSYQNVNLFSRPIGSLWAAGVCLVLLTAACCSGILYEMKGNRILMEGYRGGTSARKANWSGHFFRNPGLTGFEYLKIVQKSGGLIFIFLFLFLQIYRIQNDTYLRLPEQVYYRTYMNYLEGPLNERTAGYVAEENERYRLLEEKLAKLQLQKGNSAEEMEIKEKMDPFTAWEKVNMEYEQLLARQEEGGKRLFLVYGDGYRLLTGEAQEMQETGGQAVDVFLVSLLLVLLTAGTFSCDSGQGMDRIIGAASLGKRDTLRAKKKVACCLALISFFLVYGADYLSVWIKVGLDQFGAPVQSLFFLSGCRMTINLAEYLILLYLIRLIGVYAMLHGILAISLFCRSTVRSMLASSVLFLLPPFLALSSMEAAEKVALFPLLTGGEVLKSCLSGNMELSAAGTVALAAAIFVGAECYMRSVFGK